MGEIFRPPDPGVKWDNIPAALKSQGRWVCWRWEPKPNAPPSKKWDKPPRQVNGKRASVSDPKTWATFDEVRAAYLAGDWSGVGIVLPPDHVGVDLDHCVEDRELNGSAQYITHHLSTYTEFSPSGTGIKSICLGKLADNQPNVCRSRGLEMYARGRYFTITGDVVSSSIHGGAFKKIRAANSEVADLQAVIGDPIEFDQEGEAPAGAMDLVSQYLDALDPVRADGRDSWVNVGMAVKHALKEEGFELWHSWSQQSPEYVDEADCRKAWQGFQRESGRLVTIHTLKRLAKADGFRDSHYRTEAISAADLLKKEIVRDFIVEDVLVAAEPMLIGGPSKVLKTSIALDLAASIASGSQFLGQFHVPKARKVLMISGESGEQTIQNSLRVVTQNKGLDGQKDLNLLELSFRIPKVDDALIVDDLILELKDRGTEVLFIDPLYLAMSPGEGASNVYTMGDKLGTLSRAVTAAGITCVILHHFRKQGQSYEQSPELEDFSQSGIAEFARQWILLKRRRAYEMDGRHSLWLTHGGSAGHQGQWILEANAGTHKAGLSWDVELHPEGDWVDPAKAEKRQRELEQWESDERSLIALIAESPGISRPELEEALPKLKSGRLRKLLTSAEEAGQIVAEKRGRRLCYEAQKQAQSAAGSGEL